MNKKQLRQRIEDVANGAGIRVFEDDDACVWEWHDDPPKDLCRVIRGLRIAFTINKESILLAYWNLDEYENIDTLTEFFWRNKDQLS